MNIQRFTASTSREALAKARAVFGDSTLILSNRQTESGVEVMATAEDTLASLDDGGAHSGFGQRQQQAPSYREIASQVEEDANQLAMSTLSFQDYVRERMARRHQEDKPAAPKAAAKPARTLAPEVPAPTPRRSAPIAPELPVRTQAATPAPRMASVAMPASSEAAAPQGIVNELQALGYTVSINWTNGQDSSPPLSGCRVISFHNPDRSGTSAPQGTTVYVDVLCPNESED